MSFEADYEAAFVPYYISAAARIQVSELKILALRWGARPTHNVLLRLKRHLRQVEISFVGTECHRRRGLIFTHTMNKDNDLKECMSCIEKFLTSSFVE
jgi:hypothetical protein